MGCEPHEPLWNAAKVTVMALKIKSPCCMKTQPTLLPNNIFSKQKQYIMGFQGKRAEKQPVKAQNQ